MCWITSIGEWHGTFLHMDGNEDTPRALLSTPIRLGYARALVQPRSHKDRCRARKAHWHWYNRCGTQASHAARIQRMTRDPEDLTCIQKKSARNTCCAQEIQKVWLAGWVRFRTTSNTACPQIATWPPRSPRGHRFNMYSEEKSDSQDESDSGCVTSRETYTRNYNVCFLQLRKRKSFGHRDSLQRLDWWHGIRTHITSLLLAMLVARGGTRPQWVRQRWG